MDITVPYKDLNSAVTAAKKVGISSTKDPLQRFDCITFQVKKGYLRVGGIGPDASFVTHIAPMENTYPQDAPAVFMQNQDWGLVKKLGITGKGFIRVQQQGDNLVFSSHKDESIYVTIATETVRVHSPEADGDAAPSFEDIPWEERVSSMTYLGDSKLWLTLPDAELLVQGIDAAMIVSAPWGAAALPFEAQVVRLQVMDTPPYADSLVKYQSGRALLILATDRRRWVQTFIPLVRRAPGEAPKVNVPIGHIEMEDTAAEEPIFMTVKAAKMLADLLDPVYPTRLRIAYHKKNDTQIPMTLVATNGPSLIRVNIDMSGGYSNTGILSWLAGLRNGTYMGKSSVDSTMLKKLEIAGNLRGVENSGLSLSFNLGDLRVIAQETGGEAVVDLPLEDWADNSLGVWLEPAPFLAAMKFLKGNGEFGWYITGNLVDVICENTRITATTATAN